MSEQTKGDVQMIGAGLVGFIAVVGVAGVLFFARDSGGGAKPSRAFGGASQSSATELRVPPAAPLREAPQSSPAPFAGALPVEAAENAAPSAGPAAAPAASAFGERVEPRISGQGDSASSARAEVQTPVAAPALPAAAAPVPAAKPVARLKLDSSRGTIASAVHYGVTSRSEVMGKAAGPVYNFSGRAVAGKPQLAGLADQSGAKLTEAELKIEQSDLPPEKKREMLERLRKARQGVADAAK